MIAGFFVTKIFHPNIAKNGEICVNTLKKDWKPSLGVRHVLVVRVSYCQKISRYAFVDFTAQMLPTSCFQHTQRYLLALKCATRGSHHQRKHLRKIHPRFVAELCSGCPLPSDRALPRISFERGCWQAVDGRLRSLQPPCQVSQKRFSPSLE